MTTASSTNSKNQSKIPAKACSNKPSGSSVFDRLQKTSTKSASVPKRESKISKPRARKNKANESSVFDRLHRTPTISSRTRKVIAPVVPLNILTRNAENIAPQSLSQSKKKEHSTRPVFNRLCKQGTVSSKAKRKTVLGSKDNF